MTIRTIVHVPADKLTTDPRVNTRPTDQGRVQDFASNFNPDGMGALTISLRPDGTRIVLDGLHRQGAALAVGYAEPLVCVQYEGLTLADEASLFLVLNDTKKVMPIDKFRARVISEEADAVEIAAILDKYGWEAAASKDRFRLSAIAAFERVYNGAGVRSSDGDVLAHNVLHVITEAWGGQHNSAHASIILALGKFMGWYGSDVDHQKLIGELAGIKPMNLVADMRATKDVQRCDMANAGAQILVSLHNHRRRTNRLPAWRNR